MPVASMKELKEREELKDKMTGQPGGGGEGDLPPEALGMPVDGERLPVMFHGLYHEKQIGALCAVHAMNNLVQQRRFDEVQLAGVARALDQREAELLGTELLAGEQRGESANVRGDGFFSVQVIIEALRRQGFMCDQRATPGDPARERGFVFNRREHWFALRRVGDNWFDLNSMHRAPVAMSGTHLGLFVGAHLEKGYSVYAVRGPYSAHPLERDAPGLAAAVRACQSSGAAPGAAATPAEPAFKAFGGSGQALAASAVDPELAAAAAADPELAAAIAASLADQPATPRASAASSSTGASTGSRCGAPGPGVDVFLRAHSLRSTAGPAELVRWPSLPLVPRRASRRPAASVGATTRLDAGRGASAQPPLGTRVEEAHVIPALLWDETEVHAGGRQLVRPQLDA
eukprot:CAMPEP_0119296036 /NCGR_PEP_ID=MMETSP1329-20130426/50367_1 /TAXON_ID=114041 /ORGANISM="Genus nov. species nov., Strain RCC1024" /LENGTH=402 /DNA_ID=CAMNT_0007296965 /DNA_START=201 /DNA_END=1406 /DNA_ORIENTATION=+